MDDSFLKRGSRLQRPAQQRYLLGTQAPRRELFERAQANAVGLAQGAIDGAGFGHAHLGIVENQRRDIAGMSVAVADEAATLGRFIDRGFEHPKVLLGATQCKNWSGLNPCTLLLHRDSQQIRVCHVKPRHPFQCETRDFVLRGHPLLAHLLSSPPVKHNVLQCVNICQGFFPGKKGAL